MRLVTAGGGRQYGVDDEGRIHYPFAGSWVPCQYATKDSPRLRDIPIDERQTAPITRYFANKLYRLAGIRAFGPTPARSKRTGKEKR